MTTQLHLGDTMCVVLPGTPATGFAWSIGSVDSSIMSLLGNPEALKPTNLTIGQTGYPEKSAWHFNAVREGKTDLKMIYHRAWEKNVPPAKTFEVKIIVGGL